MRTLTKCEQILDLSLCCDDSTIFDRWYSDIGPYGCQRDLNITRGRDEFQNKLDKIKLPFFFTKKKETQIILLIDVLKC